MVLGLYLGVFLLVEPRQHGTQHRAALQVEGAPHLQMNHVCWHWRTGWARTFPLSDRGGSDSHGTRPFRPRRAHLGRRSEPSASHRPGRTEDCRPMAAQSGRGKGACRRIATWSGSRKPRSRRHTIGSGAPWCALRSQSSHDSKQQRNKVGMGDRHTFGCSRRTRGEDHVDHLLPARKIGRLQPPRLPGRGEVPPAVPLKSTAGTSRDLSVEADNVLERGEQSSKLRRLL
jgi:hypothetical protein